jgi:sarcosine oxidase
MTERFDVVVIGLGGLGSATAWQLARRGFAVLGLEQFELGHVRGASHGDSRIVRMSYHTPLYVAAARRAYSDWAQLEADSGVGLVIPCGGIDVFPVGAAIDPSDYVESMTAAGVRFDVWDASVSQQRFPGVRVPEGATVLHQEHTGMVPAGLATRTMQDRARAHGAQLRDRVRVTAVRDLSEGGPDDPDDPDGGCEVECEDGTVYRCRSVVVTADAWTNDVLAGLDVRVPLTVTKEHVVHFDVSGSPERHAQQAFPVWIWMDDPSFYGFPSYGEASVKVGQDCGGVPVDPDLRTFDPDPEYLERMREFVSRTIPGAGDVVRVTTCLYTLTPDRDFVVGRVPGHPRVSVGLGAAHGFKFAPWFGRVLADLATDQSDPDDDLSVFALDRAALTDGATVAHWLV